MNEDQSSQQETGGPHRIKPGEVMNPEGIGGFQPGESGNPGGRPKVSITALMALYAGWTYEALVAENSRMDLTAKEKIAITQLILAMDKNDSAVERILDRTEGKSVQRISLDGTEQLDENNKLLQQITGYEPPEHISPDSSETS